MGKIVIAQLDIDVEALLKSTSDVKKSLDELTKQQSELKKAGDTSSKQYIENAANLKVLNQEYASGVKVLSEVTKATAEQANRTQLLDMVLKQEVSSITEARQQNILLNKLRNDANATTAEGKKEIESLNEKLDKNNAFIKENSDQYTKQKMNIGNYTESVVDAVKETGLLTEENKKSMVVFGYLGNLYKFVKGSVASIIGDYKAATSATEGMTAAQKAGNIATEGGIAVVKLFRLALAATGIGLLIIAVGLLVNGLSKLDPIMDKIEQLAAGVGGAFNKASQILTSFVMNIKSVGDLMNKVGKFFSDPIGAIKSFGDEVSKAADTMAKLKEAEQDLGDLKDIYEVRNKNIESQIALDKIRLKSKDLTAKEEMAIEERINANFEKLAANRIEVNNKTLDLGLRYAVATAYELDKVDQKRLETSIKLGDLATANQLLNSGKITKDAYDKLKEGVNAVIDSTNAEAEARERAQMKIEAAQAKAEENRKKALDAEKKRQEEIQKILESKVELAKAELDLFVSSQGIKAKSLQDELKYNEQILSKKLEIADKEFEASKKTEADRLKLLTERNNATNDFLQNQIDLVVQNADRELQVFKDLNKSKIEASTLLTDQLVADEVDRLNRISEEEANAATVRYANGIISETEYRDAIAKIDQEFYDAKTALEQQRDQQAREQKAQQLIADREIEIQNAQDKFEEDLIRNRQNYDIEMADLKERLDKKFLTEEQYRQLSTQAEKKKQEMDKLARLNALSETLGEFAKIGNALSTLFGQNKEAAYATALVNAGLAITEIFKTPSVLPEPLATVSRFTQAAAVGVQTKQAIDRISNTKLEKGGIQEIGGKRHRDGGTKFYGEDGTVFEAEAGEGIGVLNRSAFSAFMNFNNLFGRGRANASFLESGGTVARAVSQNQLDYDYLAVKIAEANKSLPAPVVGVEQILTETDSYVSVIQGANH